MDGIYLFLYDLKALEIAAHHVESIVSGDAADIAAGAAVADVQLTHISPVLGCE